MVSVARATVSWQANPAEPGAPGITVHHARCAESSVHKAIGGAMLGRQLRQRARPGQRRRPGSVA